MKFHGKNKAVTFSFDDGVTQDKRLIELLDKYGLKSTFNLNSSLFGLKGGWQDDHYGAWVNHNKIAPSEVASVYKNHGIAVHTMTHPNLTEQDDETVAYQINNDKKALEKLTGKIVRGMAYPCGGVNNDDRVAKVIAERTEMRYARTITPTYSFDLQDNLLRFNPTVHYKEVDKLFELAEKFIELKPDKPQLFYIWGHSYEMDYTEITWELFEKFCKTISGRDDIFYGTNSEVLLY